MRLSNALLPLLALSSLLGGCAASTPQPSRSVRDVPELRTESRPMSTLALRPSRTFDAQKAL